MDILLVNSVDNPRLNFGDNSLPTVDNSLIPFSPLVILRFSLTFPQTYPQALWITPATARV